MQSSVEGRPRRCCEYLVGDMGRWHEALAWANIVEALPQFIPAPVITPEGNPFGPDTHLANLILREMQN
jgi:hypothetical protein